MLNAKMPSLKDKIREDEELRLKALADAEKAKQDALDEEEKVEKLKTKKKK